MINYLKLIRLPNLLIIVLTQYLMRYSIINSFLEYTGFELQMSDFHFALLVISTICIAAAGYVINDYFDRRIDQINKPQEVIIGSKIDRRHAMFLHINLNIIGVFIGFYLAYVVHIYLLALVYIIVTGLFWYYSTNYKRQFLIGNIIVAVLASLVPLQVVLYENVLLYKVYHIMNVYHIEIKEITTVLFWWVAAFSFYAFIINIIREIIKDIEDFEGDTKADMRTIPIVIGKNKAKTVLFVLSFIPLLAIVYYVITFLYKQQIAVGYFLLFVVAPLLYFTFKVLSANTQKKLHHLSNVLKLIMFFGVLSLLLYKFKFIYIN